MEQGKVRFIGASNFSLRELRSVQQGLSTQKIVSNQVSYSLVERIIENGMLDYCQRNAVTIIAYSPLGAGIDKIRSFDTTGALSRVCKKRGKSEAQVSLNWLVGHPGVIAIPRSSSAKHVIENCEASGWRLSEDESADLGAGILFCRRGALKSALRRQRIHFNQLFGRRV